MRNSRSPVLAAMVALLATAACDSSDQPTGAVQPEGEAARPAPVAPQLAIANSDEEWAQIARKEVPGFAGYYLEDGAPVVRLVNVEAQRGAAERVLGPQFHQLRSGRNEVGSTKPVFRSATYDFATLKDWADQLHALFTRDDVFMIDVDEVGNRVWVGVGDAEAIGAVRTAAARFGVPAAALHVVTQQRPEPRIGVRDRYTTLKGGIQIAFGQYLCTLGFNAKRNGVSVFVTNSHCTTTQYANDGVTIYQNTVAAGNAIGTEIHDRGMYACVAGVASCRRSDAAIIQHNGTRTVGRGQIVQTAWATGAAGGLIETATYSITGRYAGTAPVGTVLDKTGRTSGSTYGAVTQSCVTIGVLRCQDVSKVWSQGGDSGSPMYVWSSGVNVQLYGILWGGPGSDWTTTYSSRLAGIEADLGALTEVCTAAAGC